ncbi:MAG: DUF4869 domain-containing protein [Clostridiales bacterium]|nr:DUF4869 domain-containing protein [Clostridiales bacterium]
MLHVWWGYCKREIGDVDAFFENIRKTEWLDDPLVKEMVKSVDKSEAVDGEYIRDYTGRSMSPLGLSGGVKALIMLYKEPNVLLDGNAMGDNCGPWLVEIGKRVDCYITLGYDIGFCDDIYSKSPFQCKIINLDKITETFEEYYDLWYEFVSTTKQRLQIWKKPYDFLWMLTIEDKPEEGKEEAIEDSSDIIELDEVDEDEEKLDYFDWLARESSKIPDEWFEGIIKPRKG